MNHLINVVALFVGLSTVAAPASAAIKVFILAGQSNMVGEGGATSELTPPYNAEQPNVKIWQYETGCWVNLSPNGYVDDSTYSDKFGPELTFGYTISKLLPGDEIYLIKCAKSATNLKGHWKPGGKLYKKFIARVNEALANLNASGNTYSVEGMLWMQGEGDSGIREYADEYESNLTNFINRVRTDLSVPNMRFVVGGIMWRYKFNSVVLTAQRAVAEKMHNVGFFSNEDLPKVSSDDWHFNTAGQIELGIRFANAMAAQKTSMIPATDPTCFSRPLMRGALNKRQMSDN